MKQEPVIEYKMKEEVKTRQHKNTEHECDMNLGSKINQEVHKKNPKKTGIKLTNLTRNSQRNRTEQTHTHTHKNALINMINMPLSSSMLSLL